MREADGSEARLFARAVFRHWGALVTGGVLVGLLGLAQGLGWFKPTPAFYVVASCAALLVATFRAWRDEHRRAADERRQAERQALEIEQLKAAADATDESVPDVSDGMFWLLAVIAKNTARRQRLNPDRGGANAFPTYIGDRPVYGQESAWFETLLAEAVSHGWVNQEETNVGVVRFPLTLDGHRIVDAGRRNGRTATQPGVLVDARKGQPPFTPAI